MKIYSNKPPENQEAARGAANAQKTQGPEARNLKAPPAASAPADKVDISGKSREMADLAAAASQLPDVREARVRDIKESVEAGTYTVDPQKVAEKMLSEL